MADDLSEYEKRRLETIAKNNETLRELGLEAASAEMRTAVASKRAVDAEKKKKRSERFPAPEPTRSSKRIRSAPPQYTHEKIDRFGEEMDAQAEKRARAGPSAEEKAAVHQEAMAEARRRLEEAREKLRSEHNAKAPVGDAAAAWRDEAVRRWGSGASECATDDWEGYVASREATPAPTSPDLLLQEHFCDEPWKLLVACVLMMRVSSHDTKTSCIEGFFDLCPTPTAFLDAEAADVQRVINPLGLFDNRYRSLVELGTKWLSMPLFELGLEKHNKIWGAGPFVVDSYHIFCKDDRSVRPSDAALQSYVSWRRKHVEHEE